MSERKWVYLLSENPNRSPTTEKKIMKEFFHNLKANYGLVEPVPFEFPPRSAHWTPETLAVFDFTKRPKNESAQEEMIAVKEPDIKPQRDTGCYIS
jgi:hypothetical protein